MLRPKRVFKKQERCSSVILLKFPAEVLLIVLKHCGLTVYDRASLALTCRMMALIISAEPDMLTLTQELAHGLEEQILEVFLECSSPEFNATAEEIDHWAEERKKLSHDYYSRCDPDAARKFMLRLDEGWNTSESSYCGNCDKFVSTDEQYWIQKDIAFTYKSDSEIARAWRRGQCTHYERIVMGEDARKYASRWVADDRTAKNCPICQVIDWQHCSDCSVDRGSCCCHW